MINRKPSSFLGTENPAYSAAHESAHEMGLIDRYIRDNHPPGHVGVRGVPADMLKQAVVPESRGQLPN